MDPLIKSQLLYQLSYTPAGRCPEGCEAAPEQGQIRPRRSGSGHLAPEAWLRKGGKPERSIAGEAGSVSEGVDEAAGLALGQAREHGAGGA